MPPNLYSIGSNLDFQIYEYPADFSNINIHSILHYSYNALLRTYPFILANLFYQNFITKYKISYVHLVSILCTFVSMYGLYNMHVHFYNIMFTHYYICITEYITCVNYSSRL